MKHPLLIVTLVVALGGCAATSPPPARESQTTADDDPSQLNLKLGIGYMQSGRFDVALDKLKKAVEFDPNLAEAHNALAVLYEETGQNRLAEEHFLKATQVNPQYALAQSNYGRFLCTTGRAAQGEAQFLLAANSGNLDAPEIAYTGAAICARLQGASDRAEGYLRRALEIDPFHDGTLLEMASINHQQSRDAEASEFLERYHQQAGYHPQSLSLGIAIADAMGDSRLRREYAELLLSRFADSNEARRLAKSE